MPSTDVGHFGRPRQLDAPRCGRDSSATYLEIAAIHAACGQPLDQSGQGYAPSCSATNPRCLAPASNLRSLCDFAEHSHRLAVSVIAPSQIPPALNLPQDPGQDGRQSSLDAKLGSTSLADKLEQRRAMAVDITSDDEEEDLLADLGERGRAE